MTEIDSKYASGTLAESMAPDEMPRERLLRDGALALKVEELIAILLRTGIKNKNVLELSADIYASYGYSLNSLGGASPIDLVNEFKGLGEAKAISLVAALELGRRRLEEDVRRIQIRDTESACRYFRPKFINSTVEEFHIAVLNNHLKVVHDETVAVGGLASVALDLRLVFKNILRHDGTGFLVAHNHPAGSAKPSKQDIELTKRIEEGARTLGLNFLDHIIVPQGAGQSKCYSFRDDGLLN